MRIRTTMIQAALLFLPLAVAAQQPAAQPTARPAVAEGLVAVAPVPKRRRSSN